MTIAALPGVLISGPQCPRPWPRRTIGPPSLGAVPLLDFWRLHSSPPAAEPHQRPSTQSRRHRRAAPGCAICRLRLRRGHRGACGADPRRGWASAPRKHIMPSQRPCRETRRRACHLSACPGSANSWDPSRHTAALHRSPWRRSRPADYAHRSPQPSPGKTARPTPRPRCRKPRGEPHRRQWPLCTSPRPARRRPTAACKSCAPHPCRGPRCGSCQRPRSLR
mmetsp:Transcript_20645/g.66918  ORF Transcript_20645/g.66918 Transcript_20645/m.66918 type:complete len:222 (+) Transcript_20645:74-739(+)